jgi:hypothetical protein
MRAVGPLPANKRTLINWDPATRELSARAAPDKRDPNAAKYHTVNVVDLRDRLRNVEVGASRFAGYLDSMVGATLGPQPLPWRAIKTVSTDPC